MKSRLSGYLTRLIIFSLLLGTLPVAFIGIFSYNRSSQIIQQKVNEGNMHNLLQTEMRVEQVLNAIQYSYIHFTNIPIVNECLNQKLDYHDFQKVDEIIKDMNTLLTYQTVIKNVYLISINNDWVISDKGMSSFSGRVNRSEVLKYMKRKTGSFWVLVNEPAKPGQYVDPTKQIQLNGIDFIVRMPANSSNPSGILIINITNYEIAKLLISNKQMGEILIADEQGHLVADIGNSPAGSDISSRPYIKELREQGSSSGYFKAEDNGNMIGVNYITSDYNSWTYLSLISLSDITKESRLIGWATFIVCFLLIAVIIVMSILGSRKMYDPVRTLYRSVLQSMGTDSGVKVKDEFKFIGDRVNNLLSNNFSMTGQMQRLIEQLKELFAMKLIEAELQPDEIVNRLQMLGYTVNWSSLYVLAVQIDSFEDTGFDQKDQELMLFAVRSIVEELVPEDSRFKPILAKHSIVLLLHDGTAAGEDFRNYAYLQAEKIQRTIKETLKFKISIGISQPYNSLYETKKAFEESLEALKHRIRLGEEAILFIGDLQPKMNQYLNFPEQLKEELINSVKAADYELAENLMDQILEEVLRGDSNLQDYQIFLVRLLADMVSFMQNLGHSVETFYFGSIYDDLLQLKTKTEIRTWFKHSIIRPVTSLLEEERSSQFKKISDEVLSMIHDGYDSDLTLESCAARMNYHPSYIRRILLKVYGINFSEYLAKYRLNIAKKWLRETEFTVADIAEKLRYNNTQNFIRFFKKQEGITPGQYRDNSR